MTDTLMPAETEVRRYRQFIGGRWVSAGDGKWFEDLNPFTGRPFARVPAGTADDASAAIDAAYDAQPGWAATAPAVKQRLFLRAADVVQRRRTEITETLTAETGALPIVGRFQVDWVIGLLRQVAGWPYLPTGQEVPTDAPGTRARIDERAVGVVAAFTPWNAAATLAWRSIAAPLVCGNTVVLKPSEEAPIAAGVQLAEILQEAEFPSNVIQVVTHAPRQAGPIADRFFESAKVPLLNFTGSTATGRMLAEQAGRSMTRIVLELGGYNPAIVLDDVDLDEVIDKIAFSAFFHQGQICMNTRKAIVPRALYGSFVELIAEKAASIQVGDSLDPNSDLGPLINDSAVQNAHEWVKEAVDQGANVVAGGHSVGRCFEPTVLVDVPRTARLYAHEVFAPILTVEAADDVDEAVTIANATPYGLTSAVFSSDLARAETVASQIQAGNVHINGPSMHGEPQFPTGGVKESGWHRFGIWARENFTDKVMVTTHVGSPPLPF